MRRAPARLLIALAFALGAGCTRSGTDGAYRPRPPGTLTFNRDIAPIVFENCSPCHRPNQSGPFSLLTYDDVRSRAKQIVRVTARRYMPPWLPRPGHGDFAGARSLTDDAIGIIGQWVGEGTAEGAAADLPPAPVWKDGWQLGPPDLVLELAQPFEVPAGGVDVYQNFVFRPAIDRRVFVRAFEVNPDNRRVAHHALLLVDTTRKSRRLDERTSEPGFGGSEGMKLPESTDPPSGFFNSWNPGRVPFGGYDDMAWPLLPGMDLVLQMHLQPSGKIEKVKPAIGLYFAKTPPSRFPFVLGLRSLLIDIPAGEKNYSFETRYQLPVDVDVLAVLPHAHYLGKEMKGQATLPDGTTKWLLDIGEWDFNWQGEYRFAKPVFLPKGSVITQRFSYDNSPENPRNPQVPPVAVRYGPRSIDEMGELWIQVLPRRPEDATALENDYRLWKGENENLRKAMSILERSPNDWRMLLEVAKIRAMQGRVPEALHYAEWAIRSAPGEAEPHHVLGSFKMQDGTRQGLAAALEHFEAAIRLRPEYFEAYNDLGYVLRNLGQRGRAAQCYEIARQLAPDDPIAVYNLGTLAYEQGQRAMALELIRQALVLDPSYEPAGEALRMIQKPQ